MEWLYIARTPYWEENVPMLRYSQLRKIRNRTDVGQYTLDAVSKRLGMAAKVLQRMETGSGLAVSEDYMDKMLPELIKDLGLTEAQFYTTEKIRRSSATAAPSATAGSSATPASKPTRSVTPAANSVKIINHSPDVNFLLEIDSEGNWHIYDNSNVMYKAHPKALYVPPADIVGDSKILNRVVQL